jgi:hypothetical protein
MFIPQSYTLAIILCFITMICWGSWGNTQKLTGKSWRFELFYWDYVLGILLFSILLGFTMGSTGEGGRPFIQDIKQAEPHNILNAMIGGCNFQCFKYIACCCNGYCREWQLHFLSELELHWHLVLSSIMYIRSTWKCKPIIWRCGINCCSNNY